jgi:hypothetical protein
MIYATQATQGEFNWRNHGYMRQNTVIDFSETHDLNDKKKDKINKHVIHDILL